MRMKDIYERMKPKLANGPRAGSVSLGPSKPARKYPIGVDPVGVPGSEHPQKFGRGCPQWVGHPQKFSLKCANG